MSDCCPSDKDKPAPSEGDCCAPKKKRDWLFWGSASIIGLSLLVHLQGQALQSSNSALLYFAHFSHANYELANAMWLGMLIGVLSIGLMNLLPKASIRQAMGPGQSLKGILQAASAGIVLDLCNHGILLIASKLYKSGVSYAQVLAFLIASPWNSLSLTIVMFALLGAKWALAFIVCSFIIAVVTGLVVMQLEKRQVIPLNAYATAPENEEKLTFKEHIRKVKSERGIIKTIFIDSFSESKMIMRWLLAGIIIAALIQTFTSTAFMQTWFGPSATGLLLTLGAATIIEVCSEGLLPLAADLMQRAGAAGNAFAFMMAGVATDYTELMVLRETTGSWKLALIMPLICVPQIILLGMLFNSIAV